MFLYLVQHAEAKREEEDPARPLTEAGRSDAGHTAAMAMRLGVSVSAIYHSPKLRARQTAQIMAERVKSAQWVEEAEGLSPMDDPAIWAERLKETTGDYMLVGHLPHLERLASYLLCGDRNGKVLSFTMAGIVCLNRHEQGVWSVQWMLIPQMVRPIQAA